MKYLDQNGILTDEYYGIIYKITNIQNNKCYIGQTTQEIYEYLAKHFYLALKGEQPKKYFYNAIRKYGINNFKCEILGYCFSKDELNEAEIESIWLFRSFGCNGENFDDVYGYNMTPGGHYGLGWKIVNEHPEREKIIQKMAQSLRDSTKNKGENNPLFGRNDHCHGIINFARQRKGISDIDFYGEEKALNKEYKRKQTRKEKKDSGYKIKRSLKFKISKEFMLFIVSYIYYDKSIISIKQLCELFSQNKEKTFSYSLQHRIKENFPNEYKKLNSLCRSRQSVGEKNGRYNKPVSIESRLKQSESMKGKESKTKKIKKEDFKLLIDYFFINPSTKYLAQIFNTTGVTIRKNLKKLQLPVFSYKSIKKKELWFSEHTKEEFYARIPK
jgi:group I intron endonuclease